MDGGRKCVPGDLYNLAASRASALRHSGFSAILFLPFTKSQSGSAPDGDGYGLYDLQDLGSKNQCYSVATRFGTVEHLRRSIAILNAVGIDAYSDFVIHQYSGGNRGFYKYLGSDGKTLNGRFPKHPECFVGPAPMVNVDPVFDSEGNFGFGDMVSYLNSKPPGFMLNGTIDALQWQVRTTGIKGFRLDDTKGENVNVSRQIVNAPYLRDCFSFGECFTGNPDELESWLQQTGGHAATLDFTLHWALQDACNNGNARALSNRGLIFRDPTRSVTFRDSADTDLSPGEQIIANGLLANARLLTAQGYPMILAKDYWHDAYCYGLDKWINNLVWIHENLAFGGEIQRHGNDNSVAVFERTGAPGLLTGFNFDTWSKRTVTVETNFGPHVQLHDYTGRHPDIWTDGGGNATFTIPSNAYSNGQSYLCFSRTGYSQNFSLDRRYTTQEFFGAEDLDTLPALPGKTTKVGRIWCDEGYGLTLAHEDHASGLSFSVLDPSGDDLPIENWHGKTRKRGYHTIQVTSKNTAITPYTIAATYMGTQDLHAAEFGL